MKTELTVERLREVLAYTPETGEFRRNTKTGKSSAVGAVAGRVNCPSGYVVIGIDGRTHAAHRLAWLHVFGVWPNEVDHINGIRHDNRLANLRECTRAGNQQNRVSKAGASSTHLGVSFEKDRRKWCANIRSFGKVHKLGRFANEEDAAAAYRDAKSALHRFNPVQRAADEDGPKPESYGARASARNSLISKARWLIKGSDRFASMVISQRSARIVGGGSVQDEIDAHLAEAIERCGAISAETVRSVLRAARGGRQWGEIS